MLNFTKYFINLIHKNWQISKTHLHLFVNWVGFFFHKEKKFSKSLQNLNVLDEEDFVLLCYQHGQGSPELQFPRCLERLCILT